VTALSLQNQLPLCTPRIGAMISLGQLRLVLSTVSERFNPDIFLRFDLLKHSPDEITTLLERPENKRLLADYLQKFTELCHH
jgi:chromate reductase